MISLEAPEPSPWGVGTGAFLVPGGNCEPAVGCDLGGTSLKIVRLGPGGVETRASIPTPREKTGARTVQRLAAAIGEHLPRRRGAVPVGIAVPGFLDPTRREIVRLSNLPELNGQPLARRLEGLLPGVKVTLDADTNAAAFAEARWAPRETARVLYLTLGTGLGAALVVDGDIVRVSRHTVGQVAHLRLAGRGKRCYCGGVGCAETLLSARGILHLAGTLGLRDVESTEALERLARDRKDRRAGLARSTWRQTGQRLAELIHVLAALFSPQRIVLGGGVSAAAHHFLPEVRRRLARTLTPALAPGIVLARARLVPFSGAVGAALLALGSERGPRRRGR